MIEKRFSVQICPLRRSQCNSTIRATALRASGLAASVEIGRTTVLVSTYDGRTSAMGPMVCSSVLMYAVALVCSFRTKDSQQGTLQHPRMTDMNLETFNNPLGGLLCSDYPAYLCCSPGKCFRQFVSDAVLEREHSRYTRARQLAAPHCPELHVERGAFSHYCLSLSFDDNS